MRNRISYRKDLKIIYPFKWGLEIVITNNVKGYADNYDWGCEDDVEAFHCAFPKESKSIVVFNNRVTYGTTAHEAYHVLVSVYRYIKVKIYDEEIIAYTLEDIVDDIIDSIRSMKKKKKRYLTSPKRGA